MRLRIVPATFAAGAALLLLPAVASAQAPGMPPGALPGGPTAQQDEQAMVRTLQRVAHNQLGVLQYCQSNGNVGADVVVLQRQMLAAMQAEMQAAMPSLQVDGLEQAEAAGKRGVVQVGGREVTIADAAKARNTTPAVICKQIAATLQNQAAQMAQQPR